MRDRPVARHLPSEDNTDIKKIRYTSTSQLGFESVIPVFEWQKAIHAIKFEVTVKTSTEIYLINPSKTEFLLNNIHIFSSYFTGNILRLRYTHQPVDAV
jgi:hypothetical protein